MNLPAVAVAWLLAGSQAVVPASSGVPTERTWVPGEHGGLSIQLSVTNWGERVDLSTPGVVAWAHPGSNGPPTHVTVRIDPPDGGLHGYYGRLTAPDAVGGEQVWYCGDEYHQIESYVICGFDIPISRGVNNLKFVLQSASFDGIRSQQGIVIGASLAMVSVLEVSREDGSWSVVPTRGGVEIEGERSSALRFRIMNTGDIPFRVPGACQEGGTVWPDQQLLCVLRSPRPGFALAGEYRVPLALEDPVGSAGSDVITGEILVSGMSFPLLRGP